MHYSFNVKIVVGSSSKHLAQLLVNFGLSVKLATYKCRTPLETILPACCTFPWNNTEVP